MEVKFVDIGGLRLTYLEKNPHNSQTVFFIHGNSGSHRTWRKQFVGNIFNNYRLIAFDLPGCGQSLIGQGLRWDYSPKATGEVMAEAIRQLSGDKEFVLVGFSYGSNVWAETLNYDLYPKGISFLASCVIGNGCGLDKVFVPGDSIFFHDELEVEIVKKYFSEILVSKDEEDICVLKEDFFLAKPPFRSALIKSAGEGKLSDELALLKKQDIPVQIVFGQEDKLLQIDYLNNLPFNTWRNIIYKLPFAGHYVQIDQIDEFNRLLAEYLDERFTAGHD